MLQTLPYGKRHKITKKTIFLYCTEVLYNKVKEFNSTNISDRHILLVIDYQGGKKASEDGRSRKRKQEGEIYLVLLKRHTWQF
jgi:hypothetical protein